MILLEVLLDHEKVATSENVVRKIVVAVKKEHSLVHEEIAGI